MNLIKQAKTIRIPHILKKRKTPNNLFLNCKKYFTSLTERAADIVIDYDLITKPTDKINLSEEIDKAYGNNGLGLILIKNVPNYSRLRKKVLPYAQQLARLTPDQKSKIELKELNISGKSKLFGFFGLSVFALK